MQKVNALLLSLRKSYEKKSAKLKCMLSDVVEILTQVLFLIRSG